MKTRYQVLEEKLNILKQAEKTAPSLEMVSIWMSLQEKLKNKMLSMSIEEAGAYV
jgi:hypothetical protein